MIRPTLALAFCLLAPVTALRAQDAPRARDGWKLVWHDEFDGRGLDSRK